MNEILNIRETLNRAQDQGIPISEYTLRRAIKSGAVPCRIVGRTYLISWSNVMRWLTCEDGADNAPVAPAEPINSGIRRISL